MSFAERFVKFSTNRRVSVIMFMMAIIVFGWISFGKLSLDLLPDISYPTLTVRTEYEGVAPNEIENLLSEPIESAVGVISGVVKVSSISRPGASEVIIELDWDTDEREMDFASLDVREKLDLLELPEDAEQPVLLRFDPSLDPIMRIGLYGDESLMALRTLAEEEIEQELEGIKGVAAVKVSGGLEEEIHVDIEEAKLANLGIPIAQVVSRLNRENVNLTGGSLKDGDSEYLVRTLNEFKTVREIDDIVIGMKGGALIKLRDVGKAYRGYKEREIATRINGRESVEIAIYKEANANTVAVTKLVRQRLAALDKELKAISESVRMEIVADQSRFIEESIDEVLKTAMIGGLLAMCVLYVFLRNLRSTVIVSFAIPISVVGTFFFMYVSGVSLNIMSLGGLALGVGMLVDNSIVVLESIDRTRSKTLNAYDAANQGASEVGGAVIASTLTTVCVFVPIIFVKGIAGQLFTDQALTVTYSLLVSLFVAITVIPMASAIGSRGASDPEASTDADQSDSESPGSPEAPNPSGGDGQGTAPKDESSGRPAIPSSRPRFLVAGFLFLLVVSLPFALSGLGAGGADGPFRFVRELALSASIYLGWDRLHEFVVSVTSDVSGYISVIVCLWVIYFIAMGILGGLPKQLLESSEVIRDHVRKSAGKTLLTVAVLLAISIAVGYIASHAEELQMRFPAPQRAGEMSAGFGRGAPQVEKPGFFIGFIGFLLGIIVKELPLAGGVSMRAASGLVCALWVWLALRLGAMALVLRIISFYAMNAGGIILYTLRPFLAVFDRCFSAITSLYPRVIRFALDHKLIVSSIAMTALVLAWYLYSGLGMELIPEMSQGEFYVNVTTPVGTPLDVTQKVMGEMEQIARDHPLSERVYAIAGTSGQSGGSANEVRENLGQLTITLKEGTSRRQEEAVMEELRQKFKDIPSVDSKLTRPALFSFKTPIEIEISGYNLKMLAKIASELVHRLKDIPGLTDVKSSTEGGNPEIQIIFNRERLALLGYDISAVASVIKTKVHGDVATEFTERDRKVDVRVQAREEDTESVHDLERLIVNPQSEVRVPLSSIADVRVERGPSEIRRIDQERTAVVSANLSGLDLASAVREIEKVRGEIYKGHPEWKKYPINISGQSREMSEALSSMVFAFALAAFLVYLVMASQFESLLHPFVIMCTIPFGLIGVIVALRLTDQNISVVVGIGVVMLVGIVVNNAIVLVDCINIRRREGMDRQEAIIESGKLRLRPILMTTATTVLGLIPMAVGMGEGAELRAPMGIAVIGGLLVSTLLTLVFIPTVYDSVERAKEVLRGMSTR